MKRKNFRTTPVRDLYAGISERKHEIATLRDYDRSTPRFVVGSGSGAPVYQNGWTDIGGGYHRVSYLRTSAGVVHVHGMAVPGTLGSVIFTLPEGFRPTLGITFPGFAYNGAYVVGELLIESNGNVKVWWLGATPLWVTLSSAIFPAEQ